MKSQASPQPRLKAPMRLPTTAKATTTARISPVKFAPIRRRLAASGARGAADAAVGAAVAGAQKTVWPDRSPTNWDPHRFRNRSRRSPTSTDMRPSPIGPRHSLSRNLNPWRRRASCSTRITTSRKRPVRRLRKTALRKLKRRRDGVRPSEKRSVSWSNRRLRLHPHRPSRPPRRKRRSRRPRSSPPSSPDAPDGGHALSVPETTRRRFKTRKTARRAGRFFYEASIDKTGYSAPLQFRFSTQDFLAMLADAGSGRSPRAAEPFV